MTPVWQILRYHQETKHGERRYAASPSGLDWANQPAPFRTYEAAPSVLLPLLKKDPVGSHSDLYVRNPHAAWEFGLDGVAAFLELSVGLSAWKSVRGKASSSAEATGDTNLAGRSLGEGWWSLRINPSSGDLHPTEVHLVLPPIDPPSRLKVIQKTQSAPVLPLSEASGTGEGGIYHYNPYLHTLERRVALPMTFADRMRGHFQSPGFLVGLTTIVWRESWKYGERALRYCHHDAGHALAALSFAATLLGWKVTYLSAPSDEEIARSLALDQIIWPSLESEKPLFLAYVSPAGSKSIPRSLPADWLQAISQLIVQGQPSPLSTDHVDWPLIEETEPVLEKPKTSESSVRFETPALVTTPSSTRTAAELIRMRRSALALDGVTTISRAQFFTLLDKTLPRNGHAPFDVELGRPQVHLVIFVHRVVDLASGLYCLIREPANEAELKREFRKDFVWEKVDGPLPLYLLAEGDERALATRASCHQEIAGRGAFAIAMLSRFRAVVEKDPWRYKTLFWETGLIGQALYLEAEAQGLRATGIGCFFDDAVHERLGLQNDTYQSLYHFTVGGPIEDSRLTTLPPYAHLPRDRQ